MTATTPPDGAGQVAAFLPTQIGAGRGIVSLPAILGGRFTGVKGPIMRLLPLLTIALPWPAPVLAHGGHIADLAGHDHWVLGVGLGVIAGAALVGWLKGDKEDAGEAEAEEIDAEEQPA